MDRIPNTKLDRSKEMEDRAKLLDLQQRAQAHRPVDTGRDTLRGPSGDVIKDAHGRLPSNPNFGLPLINH